MMVTRLPAVLVMVAAVPAFTQEFFSDSFKRGFDNLSPIFIDVDGDGKPDKITPRIYSKKVRIKDPHDPSNVITEQHYITFDLRLKGGRVLKGFFTYKYGDSRADYWVYGLALSAKRDQAHGELTFYSGDDTSDETVLLRMAGDQFKVGSRTRTTDD